MTDFTLTPAEASEYGKRREARFRKLNLWCIEGEYVSPDDIAARVELATCTVIRKLRILRRLPDPITWAAIKETSCK